MSVKYFTVALLLISVSSAEDNRNREKSDLDDIFIIPEDRNWEIKLSEDLIGFRAESIGKLNTINKKIPDNLEDIINSKIKALERKLPEKLEEYLENKFNDLEKNNKEIQKNFEKLQNYVDTKLSTLEKHIYRKIDALEQLIPDKTDTNIINHKLDALKRIQLGLDGNNTCSNNKANQTSAYIEEILYHRFTELENILNETNSNTCFKFEAFNNNLNNLQDNFNKTTPEIQTIRDKLNVMDKKITEINIKNVNFTLDELEDKLFNLNENITNELNTLHKKLTDNIYYELREVQKKFPGLEKNLNKKIDELYTLEENVLKEIYNTECKKQSITGITYLRPYYQINDKSLNYITLKNDSNNNVAFFEIHLAIMSDPILSPYILLSPSLPVNLDKELGFEIGIRPEYVHLSKTRKILTTNYTRVDLSSRRFTAFYMKIDNGKLEFGIEGSSVPLLTYTDPALNTIKYFSFAGDDNGIARFLYDCPANNSK